eukprot:5972388-Prymnesium_polylepis.1
MVSIGAGASVKHLISGSPVVCCQRRVRLLKVEAAVAEGRAAHLVRVRARLGKVDELAARA